MDTLRSGAKGLYADITALSGAPGPLPSPPWVAVLGASPPASLHPSAPPTPADWSRDLPPASQSKNSNPCLFPGRNAAKEAVLDPDSCDQQTDGA